MISDLLEPRFDLLSKDYVLVQAWKKTSAYIRYHNWYSDTLALDLAAVNLPRFLSELAEQLRSPDQWVNDPLRIVPAPKSQPWEVKDSQWRPTKAAKAAANLRPLAHVSLKDQVAATAVMLCLADRVETDQMDPRDLLADTGKRSCVISYGNRLFRSWTGGELRHPWGSGKLYRAYYKDYQSFLSRPGMVADAIKASPDADRQTVIVHSDLRQFYDRVSPALLADKIEKLQMPDDDPAFYDFAGRLLNWEWHKKDRSEVAQYQAQADLSDFSRVALPQGLVAAGFFANVVLLGFDAALRFDLSKEIAAGIHLEDACRYVDDLRIVLTTKRGQDIAEIEQSIVEWLQFLLDYCAKGLMPSAGKTLATVVGGEERPLVGQSRKMARIQGAVSGGFDAIGGDAIIDAIQGLMCSQQRYSDDRTKDKHLPFSPMADVGDATVARFAAGRFRSTYRSLRPLLADHSIDIDTTLGDATASSARLPRTQMDLDDEARAFALGLIENWVEDPSNVRLLRIGLDLWPAADVLARVLGLLRPFTEKGGKRKAPRRVAWYCLSEIFRAGATETGFVEDNESLPQGVDIAEYRSVLCREAVRLASLPPATLPWYLKQQVLLFLAANAATEAPVVRTGRSSETKHYRELIRFLSGKCEGLTGLGFATLAVLVRRAFGGRKEALRLASGIGVHQLEQIADRDPSFGFEILTSKPEMWEGVTPRLRDDLCLNYPDESDGWVSLAQMVLERAPNGPLRNELSMLRFASKFLDAWSTASQSGVITPVDIFLKLSTAGDNVADVDEIKITPSRVKPDGSLYSPPSWCPTEERWRFQLGYLLRFILTARRDFTQVVRPPHWKERENAATYRAPGNHWYHRLYALYNGHSAFGDDWLPISDWTEQMLSALLSWPGCRASEMIEWVWDGIGETRLQIEGRINEIASKQGALSGLLMLPLSAPWPVGELQARPLRACVVQTVIPTPDDFKLADLTFSDPAIRKRHRNHLSTALAAIERMLDLRETHQGRDHRLDWLILPELSVHPCDVKTHLVPFARKYKTIILAGLTYQEMFAGHPLVNSAIWVIPAWTEAYGLQMLTRRQGKFNLAPNEERFNDAGGVVQGFRPCQWLVGYDWSSDHAQDRPLWLTASICYDATDLRLAADLRNESDVFAIPALNQDVATYDQMGMALHYHMFQMVIVANNGLYGGSSAYAPYRETYERQIFHMHGQPQASVAFLEINDVAAFVMRTADARAINPPADGGGKPSPRWKYPPAGITERFGNELSEQLPPDSISVMLPSDETMS